MRKWNLRPQWIAVILIALAFLAFFAWRSETGSLRENATLATRSVAENTSRPSSSQPRAGTSGPEREDAQEPTEVDPETQTCDRDYKSEVRKYRAQLGSARTSDEAIDRLLLDTYAMGFQQQASAFIKDEYLAARERWPHDIDLAWLATDICGADCDHDEVQNLLAVDPNNTAAWMVAMGVARQRNDPEGFSFALRRANAAKIYDPRTGVVFLHLRKLLANVPQPESCRAPQFMDVLQKDLGRTPTTNDRLDGMAGSLDMTIALPPMSGLVGCRAADVSMTESRRTQCIALLSRVAGGDTLVEQVLASSILIRLQPAQDQLVQLREQYRRLSWLRQFPQQKPFPENYFSRVYTDGEVATMQALAIERHQWPPPPNWLPDDPHARALILGEDPPPH